jgi:hypothetical protein
MRPRPPVLQGLESPQGDAVALRSPHRSHQGAVLERCSGYHRIAVFRGTYIVARARRDERVLLQPRATSAKSIAHLMG